MTPELKRFPLTALHQVSEGLNVLAIALCPSDPHNQIEVNSSNEYDDLWVSNELGPFSNAAGITLSLSSK